MMTRFPLLKFFLTEDAEGDQKAEDRRFHEISADEWEAFRTEYKIPSSHGIVCIVEFDEDADELTKGFVEKLGNGIFCLSNNLGSRACFFLSGVIRHEKAERLVASIQKSMPETRCDFGIGENVPGFLIGFSFIEALRDLRLKKGRSERRLKDRLRVKELRRRIGIAEPDEMRRLFRLLWNDVFTDSSFTLAKARLFTFFT
ncbi:MAG: hypothetical protein LBP71_01580, partial [Spirochaetaceae bacterium]|nr:hypothetical protein [Spirochaetaceae bacterium]